MMNKAVKKVYEAQAIANAYNSIESLLKSETQETEYWKKCKKTYNEEHAEDEYINTEFYNNCIEEHEIRVKAIEKVLKIIYKLM